MTQREQHICWIFFFGTSLMPFHPSYKKVTPNKNEIHLSTDAEKPVKFIFTYTLFTSDYTLWDLMFVTFCAPKFYVKQFDEMANLLI